MSKDLDYKVIAELKGLVMDATRRANSGHPGGAFSSSDFACILFMEYLKFAPKDYKWHNRDRFILSAGHESMLLYSLLHFMDLLELDEIKNFRKLGSLTPGHPENHLTKGVEATTGPLGQGVAMAVGMAVAEAHQSAVLGADLFSHNTFCLCGDGDLQEDVAIGACAMAGHLGLSNLVLYYDKNNIQISGPISRASSTDFNLLFSGLGWDVIEIDGHNHDEIRAALDKVKTKREKPLIIIGTTTICNGAFSLSGSHKTHGEPLPVDEIANTKEKLGLIKDATFQTSIEAKNHFNRNLNKYNDIALEWKELVMQKRRAIPTFNTLYPAYFSPDYSKIEWPEFKDGDNMASRKAFGMCLEAMAKSIKPLIGGSADLEPSNNTEPFAKVVGEYNRDNYSGRNIAFGVREFPMTAMQNGMALHGGMLPFGATFLTFSDYSRNAIRMSAIQQLQTLHVFTHDSFYLGEDGPTHQPIEHVMSLRLIPELLVLRPADAHETKACLELFLSNQHRPSLIALTRQNLPNFEDADKINKGVKQGGYIIYETENWDNDAVIFASGSEVSLAMDAAKLVEREAALKVRIVSLPCWEVFFEQSEEYIEEVMSKNARLKVSIEAGVTTGWQKFTSNDGLNIGIDHFGESAPHQALAEKYGFTPSAVAHKILQHYKQKA